jgi:hypothetical protein
MLIIHPIQLLALAGVKFSMQALAHRLSKVYSFSPYDTAKYRYTPSGQLCLSARYQQGQVT